MPESKSRHPHKHPSHHDKPPVAHAKHQKTNQSIIVAVIFFALIGLGISYFIGSGSVAGLIIGTLIGGIAGYIFGKQVNKSLLKK
jgi:membrane associated rhomboid family serine protease